MGYITALVSHNLLESQHTRQTNSIKHCSMFNKATSESIHRPLCKPTQHTPLFCINISSNLENLPQQCKICI